MTLRWTSESSLLCYNSLVILVAITLVSLFMYCGLVWPLLLVDETIVLSTESCPEDFLFPFSDQQPRFPGLMFLIKVQPFSVQLIFCCKIHIEWALQCRFCYTVTCTAPMLSHWSKQCFVFINKSQSRPNKVLTDSFTGPANITRMPILKIQIKKQSYFTLAISIVGELKPVNVSHFYMWYPRCGGFPNVTLIYKLCYKARLPPFFQVAELWREQWLWGGKLW